MFCSFIDLLCSDVLFDVSLSSLFTGNILIYLFLPKTAAKSLPLGKNIKVASWLPQNDILGHPKTRLFIGHAGMNGMLQAGFHGVPMICVPFFGDQFDNSIAAKHFGMAEILYKESITKETLVNAINTVLNNARFVG